MEWSRKEKKATFNSERREVILSSASPFLKRFTLSMYDNLRGWQGQYLLPGAFFLTRQHLPRKLHIDCSLSDPIHTHYIGNWRKLNSLSSNVVVIFTWYNEKIYYACTKYTPRNFHTHHPNISWDRQGGELVRVSCTLKFGRRSLPRAADSWSWDHHHSHLHRHLHALFPSRQFVSDRLHHFYCP